MAQPSEAKEEETQNDKPETIDLNEVRKEKLVRDLKKEVKQIMEEAVTRRFIHEESTRVTSLCAAVEACLAHGLKRRVLGLFGTISTFALLHKISKLCPPAASVLRIVIQTQQKEIKERRVTAGSLDKFRNSSLKDLPVCKYLWIRVAIFEKLLPVIVDFIVREAEKFYDKEALMMDSVHACMVASLLVGPCALEYTKLKTMDHYWTDPPADELIQRHRLHSRQFQPNSPSPKSPRPTLQVRRSGSVGPEEFVPKVPCSTGARDYVLSLHQNHKTTLLYGKNNVSVCPPDMKEPLKGYLSLHQNANGTLSIKWTPNELMHSDSEPKPTNAPPVDKNVFWQYALNLNVDEIVYLHFHQQGETGGSIVFVGADGVQHPPVHFPMGQHPLAFLSCLENGLLPWGQLDPPLWLQKGKGKVFPKLRRRTSSVVANGAIVSDSAASSPQPLLTSSKSEEESETAFDNSETGSDVEKCMSPISSQDFVFRIVPVCRPGLTDELSGGRTQSSSSSSASAKLVALSSFSSRLKERFLSISSSPASSPPMTPKTTSSGEIEEVAGQNPEDHAPLEKRHSEPVMSAACATFRQISHDSTDHSSPSRTCLKSACDSMRYQILSRAFYGWLAHCRHLQTIRTHLSCLAFSKPAQLDSVSRNGLSDVDWNRLREHPSGSGRCEFYKLVYMGGVSPGLRRSVWPYLLEFVSWTEGIDSKLDSCRKAYETMILEWMVVEAIVRQRDKEMFEAARESQNGCSAELPNDLGSRSSSHLSGDVFDPNTDTVAEATGQMGGTKEEEDFGTPRAAGASPELPLPTQTAALSEEPTVAQSSGRSTPEEGDGGIYSKELVDTFALNLHRIEKDVHRCDRNYPYFTNENLEKLKNVMCTYVWEHLESGYVQGMCDLAAPLLVIFDDEVLAYGCFAKLMERMSSNFPHGGGMDMHLANMRSLIQVMDPELFELMHRNGDYTHFYFCYRWFLLDFKRELLYEDVFLVWEVIWAASKVSSCHFVLFLALGLLMLYREIILDNNMDFTDIIKFFNEMAEKHDAVGALELARNQVERLQMLIETNTK